LHNIGDFIYASPKEMDGITGVGSVMRVEKGEVSFAFLQQNNLLDLVSSEIAQLPAVKSSVEQVLTPPVVSLPIVTPEPILTLEKTASEQVLTPPVVSLPIVTPEPILTLEKTAPELVLTPEITTPDPTVKTGVEPELGVSLGIDPAANAEAVGKRNRSNK
jgi:hypothetical protein